MSAGGSGGREFGGGFGGVALGREEEIAGAREEMAPEGAADFEVVLASDIACAKSEAEREGEADAEVQDEGEGDAKSGHEESAAADDFGAARGDAESERAGGEGDVADVERNAEEAAEAGSHAEHEAEDDGAAPGGDVARKVGGDALEGIGVEEGADAVLLDGARKLVVKRPVFDPAAGEAREPEDDAGERGVDDGAAAERVHGFDGVVGEFGVEVRAAEEPEPGEGEDDAAGADGDDIAESSSELRADDAGDVFDELGGFGSEAVAFDDAGESGAGHGRLLGGKSEVEDLHEDEADGVVEASEKAFDEGRKAVVGDHHFDGSGADGEEAAAESRFPHLPVFVAAGGDVVLAGFASPFDNFAGEQAEAVVDKAGDAAVGDAAADHFAHEATSGDELGKSGLGDEDTGDDFHADETFLDDVEGVDDVEIDAAGFEMMNDDGEFGAAFADVGLPGGSGGGDFPSRADGVNEGIAAAREAIERGNLNAEAIAAAAKLFGESEALNASAEKREGVEEPFDSAIPCGILGSRSDGENDVIGEVGRKIEEAVHFAGCGEKPEEESGEVGFLARLGEKDIEGAVGELREKAAVAGEAGFGEEADAVGAFEDGGDDAAIAIEEIGGLLEDGDPGSFALPAGGAPGRGVGLARKRGDHMVVGLAEPDKEGDEGVFAGAECFGGEERVGAAGEGTEGGIALLGGRKHIQNLLLDGIQAGKASAAQRKGCRK